MTWTDDTPRVRGGGGVLLREAKGSPSPATGSHLIAVLGLSILSKGETKMSLMYIVLYSN